MGWFSKKESTEKNKIDWNILNEVSQLKTISNESREKPIAIFKHSTRCSISSMAKSRLEREWELTEEDIKIYYLDLIAYRSVSNEIEQEFVVEHQSPQLLLIKDGEVTYHTSHSGISAAALKQNL